MAIFYICSGRGQQVLNKEEVGRNCNCPDPVATSGTRMGDVVEEIIAEPEEIGFLAATFAFGRY